MKCCSRCGSSQLIRNSLFSSYARKTCAGVFLALGLGALIMGAYFYGISKLSASSLVIQTQAVSEKYQTGTFGHAEVDVTVKIMSNGPYDLNLSRVTFGLKLDNTPFPSVQASSSAFSADQSVDYTLTFLSKDAQDASFFSQATNQTITVSITAWVSSGIYSGWVTASDSRIWTFQFYYPIAEWTR